MADLAADLAGAVAQLVAVTGCEPHQALTLLQQSGGNIEMAANEFFFSSEAGAGDASGGEDDDGMTDGSMTDDYDEAAADAVMGEAAAAAPLPMSRPPPKRPKLEQRPAPQLPEADAAALRMAKEVFALAAVPADAGDKLHRAVRERMESWAYGDDRGLRYLLGCWGRAKRLEGAAAPSPVSSFAVDSVLYHARSTLVSGAADDDGLSLFGHSEEGEVAGLLRSSFASAAPFVAGVNASMSETEQELIYGPAIEAVLRKLDPYSGGAVIPVGGSTTSAVGWRGLLDEAEALLGLVGGGSGAPLKPAPHGAAARAVLGRRMAEETARLRAGEWSGREAEGLGLLRLFSTAPAGLPGYGLAKTPAGGGSCHHDDAGVLRAAWDEVWQLQTRQRLILTAAVLKESESRTAALNWIGAVLAANVAAVEPAHAQPGAEAAVARARAAASAECTVLNLSSVLLQLCAPFLEVSAERTGKGHDGYSRLDTLWLEREGVRAEASRGPKARHAPPPREPTLRQDGATGKAGGGGGPAGGAENGGDAGEFGENNEEADELAQAIRMSLLSSEGSPSAAPSAAAPAPAVAGSGVRAEMEHHFVTECFFLAMKAVHVGRLPAMRRSERQYHDLLRRSKQPPLPPTASTAELAASLDAVRAAGLGSMQAQVLAYRCLLEGPQPHALMMRYMSLVGAWLAHLAGQPEAQTHFSRLPASALTDVCDALALLARSNPKHLISAPEAGGLISRCLCRFLGERELVPSPFVRQSIAELMHTLVQMDEHTARTRGDGFGGFFGSPLLGLIHLDAAADAQLPLLRLYVELGLHTNSAAVADKNGDRYRIMGVLRALWQQPQAWRAMQLYAIASLGTAPGPAGCPPEAAAVFGEFAETLVKELVFLLSDALGRLADVHTRQEEMADAAAWAAQPAAERRRREERLEQVKRTARGFLDLAKASLSALLLLTHDRDVGPAFAAHPGRAAKLAAMLVEFLRRLVGPEALSLKVHQPEKLGWDPRQMLTHTTQLLLHAVAVVPPFVHTLRAADNLELPVLRKTAAVLKAKCNFPPLELAALDRLIAQLAGGGGGAGAVGEAASVMQAAVVAAAAIEAEAGGPAALLQRVNAGYVAEMRPHAFDEAPMEQPGGYAHYYRQNIADAPQNAVARTKLRRLVQELAALSADGNLPLSAESAILARRDEARMDVLKVLISGPADALDPSNETPYALGLFEFHLFIPPHYPSVPPLVNLQTTGGGMVRFNPNLYSDGKVCLSLLGTWHGEGWTPPTAGNSGSTILQVLVSIQSIIMVPKPYFNEPGYAEEEGTPAGEQRSREYNDDVRLHTLRHAMRDVLRKPPAGFEPAVAAHFRHVRPMLLRQAARWLAEAGPSVRAPMERAFTEVKALLDALDEAGGGSSGVAPDGEAAAAGERAGA